MELHEKEKRCLAAEQRYTGECTQDDCRVYSRWVRDCADCSFNYLDRIKE